MAWYTLRKYKLELLTLESVDLMSLTLGKEEILVLTNNMILSDLKILKIKMPLCFITIH